LIFGLLKKGEVGTAENVGMVACILLMFTSPLATLFLGEGSGPKIRSIVEAAELDLAPVIGRLEAQRLVENPGSHHVAEHPFLFLESSAVPKSPGPIGPVRLRQWWYNHFYPPDVVDDLERGALQELPSLSPRTAVIFTKGTETVRMIRLDDGNLIPGYRVWEVVTLVDIQTGVIYGQSRILGPGPSDPGHVSPGIHYFSSVTGDDLSSADEEAAIESLSGRH
jgi:hypothetical protein